MNTRWQDWLRALAAEAIEGGADAFLIVSGGSALSQATPMALPTITAGQLCWSVALGALWYAAAWLKAHPLPSAIKRPARRSST